ncbi:isoamyl acetate-hydrolyzing esterase [Basidiobolus ranarum]|uniref:Isoamyl acetate-hydrolyzing esterase n=1 Tax=Basidiobolus ranarum TaxID=34480 RepID=A0ABR2VXD5_9FUNG
MFDFKKIVLFGDSITQYSFNEELKGWGAALEHRYARKLDVVNRGFSGYNTAWAKHIFPQILPVSKDGVEVPFELVTIFFGANDAALPSSPQHVPLEQYQQNLRELINMIHSPESKYYSPNTRILLITPPPLDETAWEKHCLEGGRTLDRNAETTYSYVIGCSKVGEEMDIPVVNLWQLINEDIFENESELIDYLLDDGLHLNSVGNDVLTVGILDAIKKFWPDIYFENLDMTLPWWGDIDPSNPVEYLNFPN